MRLSLVLLALLMLTGCTALVVGGAAGGGDQPGKYERAPSVVTSDSAITTTIKRKYVADAVVSGFNIGVRTYEGTVYLSGTVSSYVARDQAIRLAKETGGVTAVNNQIVIEDQSK